jgi:hypothetical protein
MLDRGIRQSSARAEGLVMEKEEEEEMARQLG